MGEALTARLEAIGCGVGRAGGSTVTGGRTPDIVIEPPTVSALADVARLFARHGVPWRVDALGRNWGYDDSRVPDRPQVLVRLARLRDFTVDADLGTVTVQPGVTFQDVRSALAGTRFHLPVPGSGPHTSVLGNALERGLLHGLGEREAWCRDFLVMDRDNGSLTRPGWPDATQSRARAGLLYAAGPHRRGELFQAGGTGPVVVELTHALPVRPRFGTTMALLAGSTPTHDLLTCWRTALLDDLMIGSVLQPAHRRALQGYQVGHPGLTVKFNVGAGSRTTLTAKIEELRELAHTHGLRVAADRSGQFNDLAMIGADVAAPAAVGDGPTGIEWQTVAIPFIPALILEFWTALVAEPALSGTAWSLRALDVRALVWMFPLVYRKGDPAGVASLRGRIDALTDLRSAFALPQYRTGALRGVESVR